MVANKSYNRDNIFYKIINKELEADIIYEDDQLISIRDINPVAPVHFLVIPKKCFIDFDDFIQNSEKDFIISYYRTIRILAQKEGLKEYRVLSNIGSSSGQSIFHFHTHVIGGKILKNLC